MNWENFSNKCAELLGDKLIGIHLLSPSAEDRIPGFDGRLVTIVLKQCDRKTLEKIREIGKNFYEDETGMDTLFCQTVDELKERGAYYKAAQLMYRKTIWGKGITELIKMPSKKELSHYLLKHAKHYKTLITPLVISFEFLTERRKKGQCYLAMNETLRLTSVFYFIQGGEYLVTRDQLRKTGDSDVTLICDLFDKYKLDSASSHDIDKGLWASLSLLSHIENELKAHKS